MGICNCSKSYNLLSSSDCNFNNEKDDKKKTTKKSTNNSSFQTGPNEQLIITSKPLRFTLKQSPNKLDTANEQTNHTSPKELTLTQRENIFKCLKNHLKFSHFLNEKNFDTVEKHFSYGTLPENSTIFSEGDESRNMYVIISGVVELFLKGSDKTYTLMKYSTFGEGALLSTPSTRSYSSRSLTMIQFLSIDYNSYSSLLLMFNHNKKRQKELNAEIQRLISCIPLLSFLESTEKLMLASLSFHLQLKNTTKTMNEPLYIVKSGVVKCMNKKKNIKVEITENMFYGVRDLLCENKPSSLDIEVPAEAEIFVVPMLAFIETLGVDYRYQIIFPYFKTVMMQSDFFSNIFNELQLVPVYEIFTLKSYLSGDVVFQKKTKGKIAIVIEGELVAEDDDKSEFIFGKVYGEELITHSSKYESNIIAKYNSIVIETDWEEMKKKISSFNSSIIKKMGNLSKMAMLRGVTESKMIEIASVLKKEKYLKNDIILPSATPEDNEPKFYFIVKGETKLIRQGKARRRYAEGNCFGEIFLLKVNESTDKIVASSDLVTLYSIDSKYFAYLLSENVFNDFIKHKMCNEDTEIKIDDLYYVESISKKISLVHNQIEFYAAKAFNKTKENYIKIKREVNAKRKLDHIFISKIASLIENENFFIILYEYLPNSISLTDYVLYNKTKTANIITINKSQNIFFYAASLFLAINYIHRKKFVHGSINTDNILIDAEGYIKIKNFTNSNKPNKEKHNTLDTYSLLFTAPEVLSGDSYSFAADYWSIGIVLYFLFFEAFPFDINDKCQDPMAILSSINKSQLCFNGCEFKMKEMLESLLTVDKTKRIQCMGDVKKLKCYDNMYFDDIVNGNEKPPFIPKNQMSSLNYSDTSIKYKEILENEIENVKMEFINNIWLNNF